MRFKGKVLETWTSTCSFQGADKKFETVGDPERWLSRALAKARPPLSSLGIKLEDGKPSTTTFNIRKQVLKDPPLGTAEIEGTGVITITPDDV